jgi:flagellar hook-associated protein 1 FlgK
MSTFSGLNVGLSSLYAQRRGLELTGHNVANANTEATAASGCSCRATAVRRRRRCTPAGREPGTASRSPATSGCGTPSSRGGRCASGTKDTQLRTDQTTLSRLEGVFGEPSDSGIASQLSDFWAGFDAVAKHPTDRAARSQLLERAATLADGLNDALSRIDAQASGWLEKLGVVVPTSSRRRRPSHRSTAPSSAGRAPR